MQIPLMRTLPVRTFMILLALLVGAVARADTAVLSNGRLLRGEGSLAGDKIMIGDQAIGLPEILSFARPSRRAATSPNAVRLRNGELWFGTIIALRGAKLKLELDAFGEKEIDVQLLSSVEFYPGRDEHIGNAGPENPSGGRIYRIDGRPITGRLIGINARTVRVKSTLGAVNLPRAKVLRYVFDHSDHALGGDDADELGLTNGSVCRGTLSLKDGHAILTHAMLGELKVAGAALRYVLQNDAQHVRLVGMPWQVVQNSGPVGPLPPPVRMRYRYGEIRQHHERPAGHAFVEAIRFSAGSALQFDVSPRTRPGRFVASASVDGSAAGVLKAAVDGKAVSQTVIEPGAAPVVWAFDLPVGTSLVVGFEFHGQVRVPNAAILGDPVVRDR